MNRHSRSSQAVFYKYASRATLLLQARLMNVLIATAIALAVAGNVLAQQRPTPGRHDMGPGMGPEMMGGSGMGHGMGPGMMGGSGTGYGMGAGMMGGWGQGYGMGPGMMGDCGYGMGPAYAMGPGRTRGDAGLGLSEQQRAQITKIQKETRSKHWEQMSKLHQEYDALYDLYDADPINAKSIGEQYKKVSELRRQMLVSSIEARNRFDAILSKEQKEKLREQRRGSMMWGY